MKKVQVISIMFFLVAGDVWAEWEETVDTAGVVGQYVSADNFSEDYNYGACVSYYDSTNGDLKLAVGVVSFNIMKIDTAGDVGRYTSVKTCMGDTVDSIWISYYDVTNGNLKCAFLERQNRYYYYPTIKTIYSVDTAGDVGMCSCVDIDRFGHPHISYYDVTKSDLKCAKWNGSNWDIESVDTAGDVGSYSSIRTAYSNDSMFISYYDSTNGDLKFAIWDGSIWNIQKLDTAGDVGKATSMNGYGDVKILYYDETNGDLKCAMPVGGSCTPSIDGTGDVGRFNFISRSKDKYFPCEVMCWYDNTNKNLKSDFCGVEDSTGDVGKYCACATDRGIVIWFFYYDATNSNLKYRCYSMTVEENSNPGTSRYSGTIFLSAFPNPFVGTTNIRLEDERFKITDSKIRIYDISGKLVETYSTNLPYSTHSTISIGKNLNPGIYFVEIGNSEPVKLTKIR